MVYEGVVPIQTTHTIVTEPAPQILVVEDERIIARDLAATLTELGYTVLGTAATGEEAVEKAAQLNPNLVLMDIRLAGAIDGIEAASRIRQNRDVPIIYLTSHSDAETLRRAQDTYPLAYLVKPFRAPDMRCAIEIALHKHEIETVLRERERWLTTTLQSIADGVVSTDPEEKILLLNPVAQALTGWAEQDAVGKRIDEILSFVTQDGRFSAESPIQSALKHRMSSSRNDTSLVKRDGEVIPVSSTAAPILAGDGDVLGGVVVLRDMTEQKQTEEAIRQLNTELERRVAERTTQLEQANHELEAFSYSVAHDLRAPLRGIDGFSQALIEDHAANLGPEALAKLARVRNAVHRMRQLIEDLLRLSRVGQCPLSRSKFDLGDMAQAIYANLSRNCPDRNISFSVGSDMWVDADESLVRIALENLLGNSFKFTSKIAQPSIEIGVNKAGLEHTYFIHDNGAGFEMAYAHKLFGAFQRLHSTTEFDGTGIGLAIVQRIIHRHGGRVWAQSAVNQGATFFFTLPVASE